MPPATPKLDAAALKRAVDRLLRLDEEVQAALDKALPGFLDKLRAELPKLVKRAAREQAADLADRLTALEERLAAIRQPPAVMEEFVAGDAQALPSAASAQDAAAGVGDGFITPGLLHQVISVRIRALKAAGGGDAA